MAQLTSGNVFSQGETNATLVYLLLGIDFPGQRAVRSSLQNQQVPSDCSAMAGSGAV
jgi:hypothetical protein